MSSIGRSLITWELVLLHELQQERNQKKKTKTTTTEATTTEEEEEPKLLHFRGACVSLLCIVSLLLQQRTALPKSEKLSRCSREHEEEEA
jgi:hypothetical protein